MKIALLTATLALATSTAFAGEVSVSGDWITLGDVAAVSGAAAQKPIAASPLPGQRMPLAAEFVEMQASAAGFPIDLPDGEMIWVTRLSVEVPEMEETTEESTAYPDEESGLVPVLIHDVKRGDPITADMIAFEAPDPKRRIQGMIRSARHLSDTEAVRTIRAGQPLSLRDIKPVSVLRKGDPVQLVYQVGALRLSVSAKALSDAAKGETVRVINLQSKRTMDATAFAPGEARVSTAGL